MGNTSVVEHQGVVEQVIGSRAKVRFVAHPSCSGCHARGACSLSETETKYVEAEVPESGLKVGDQVDIRLETSLGLKAVFYGYGLPLLLLMFFLLVSYAITGNEAIAALFGLGVLFPYYGILYYTRKRLEKSFRFTLRKQRN